MVVAVAVAPWEDDDGGDDTRGVFIIAEEADAGTVLALFIVIALVGNISVDVEADVELTAVICSVVLIVLCRFSS